MKYSLYKTLTNDKEVLSHVFFNCADEFIVDIANKNIGMTTEEIEARQIDIELKIDGHICDPKKFFDILYEQYSSQVKKTATDIVKEQVSEKFSEISNKLTEYQEITESWANDINWQVESPFGTKS